MNETIRKGWEAVLEMLESGEAVLLAGSGIDGLPGIHNFYDRNTKEGALVSESIKHQGFGFFEGHTESGEFSFDAGGAMRSVHVTKGELAKGERHYLSWTPLRCSEEVLADLGYDIEAAKEAVKGVLA